MIQVLVTIAITVVFLFILVVLLSLMAWVVVKVLRFLFPEKFAPTVAPKSKKAKKKLVVVQDPIEED